MESIIQKFFEIYLSENPASIFLPKKEKLDREWELFNLFINTLSGKEKELFCEYANLRTEKEHESVNTAYVLGFKNAVKLITECLKE